MPTVLRAIVRVTVGHPPLIALLAAYVVLYGGLLLATDFLPYVLDNNETFSSLWHAANLFNFGASRSWGLADEAFSPHPEAHPYVHTHQGNFPRLFAFLIYVVGARTAEAQIAITTFTVGLAAIGLIYAFFARIANPWFAFTVCAVFMTDYLLFAQWHVVTYRVWHSFFLFGCLLSVQRATESDERRWWWLTALAFGGLFYSELIFAAFVGAFCFLYAVARTYHGSVRRLVRIVLAQAIGGAVGLAVVIAQVVGYLGPEDLRRDVYFTLFARTDFAAVANLIDEVAKFYESRHVVFWHNFEERSKFAGLISFVRSFTSFDWRIHTPLLSMVVWTVCAGWVASLLPRVGYAVTAPASRSKRFFGYAVLFGGITLFASDAAFGESALQIWITAIVAGSVTILAFLFASERLHSGSALTSLAATHVLMGIGVIVGAAGVLNSWHGLLFDVEYRPMWEELQGKLGPPWVGSLGVIAAAAVSVYIATVGPRALGPSPHERLSVVLVYLVCGGMGYAIVYLLSPGYIYSGYLVRHAPFTVFLTDVMVATAIYLAVKSAVYAMRNVRISDVGVGWLSALRGYGRTSIAAAAAGLAVFLVAYWLVVQLSYVRWLPPNHYGFLKSLSEPPYRGASFVVDNYAAPVAAYTRQWAYEDQEISEARFVRDKDAIRLAGDRRYLWFADRDSNAEYRRPRYFLCMVAQSPSSVLAGILHSQRRGRGYAGCSARPLVRLAKAGTFGPALELVAADAAGVERIGFDSWAIVKLQPEQREPGTIIDWDMKRQSSGQKQEIK